MATLRSAFGRLFPGATTVTAAEAEQRLLTAGELQPGSITGKLLHTGLAKGFAALGKTDVGSDDFTAAVRTAFKGTALPTWETIVPDGRTALGLDDLAELVKHAAKQKAGMFGAFIDSRAVARVIIAVADDDGDGQFSKDEAEGLAKDLG